MQHISKTLYIHWSIYAPDLFITHCILVIKSLALFISRQNSWTHNDTLLSVLSSKAWAVRLEYVTGVLEKSWEGSGIIFFTLLWIENDRRTWLAAINRKQIVAGPQTRNAQPILVQCCPIVLDVGLALYQHWLSVSCLLVGLPLIPGCVAHLSSMREYQWR